MSILIDPNYDLFVKILFALWVLKGLVNAGNGVMGTVILVRDSHGGLEIIAALIMFIVVIVVLTL